MIRQKGKHRVVEIDYSIVFSFISILIGDFPGVEISASGALIILWAAFEFIKAIIRRDFSPLIFLIMLNLEYIDRTISQFEPFTFFIKFGLNSFCVSLKLKMWRQPFGISNGDVLY